MNSGRLQVALENLVQQPATNLQQHAQMGSFQRSEE